MSKKELQEYLRIKGESLDIIRKYSSGEIMGKLKNIYIRVDFVQEVDEIIKNIQKTKEKYGMKKLYKSSKTFFEKGEKKKAFIYLDQISKYGYAPGQNDLGNIYREGSLIDRDYSKALNLYRKAAEQDYGPAQNNLACMFDKGLGVDVNKSKAEKWYEKAIEEGSDIAKKNLITLRGNFN